MQTYGCWSVLKSETDPEGAAPASTGRLKSAQNNSSKVVHSHLGRRPPCRVAITLNYRYPPTSLAREQYSIAGNIIKKMTARIMCHALRPAFRSGIGRCKSIAYVPSQV